MTDKQETKNEKKTPDNVVKIEDIGPCKKKVSIEIPEETIKDQIAEQYSELKKDAIVPGFRKGKAPLRLIEKKFSSEVSERIKLQLLAESSENALKDNELDTLGDPDIDFESLELPHSGPLKYDFDIEVRPQFDLPSIQNIPVDKPKIQIDDKQIDEQLLALRKRMGLFKPTEDGKIETTDQIIADVVKTIEDAPEPEKLENEEITVRQAGIIAGVPVQEMAKNLENAKIGDTKEISLEIPKSYYDEDLRGKKANLKITVKEIKRLHPAELNEQFFNRFQVDSEEELRENIQEEMESQAENQARNYMAQEIRNYLLENTDFDLPENIVADQSQRLLQRQHLNLMMQGLSKDQLQERMDELQTASDEQAEQQLKTYFLMDKVADQLDVEVSEEEINGFIARAAARAGRRPEKMREEMIRDGSLANFNLQVREEKCIEKLLENAKVTEVDPEKLEKKSKKD